jgi:hypothetical protein
MTDDDVLRGVLASWRLCEAFEEFCVDFVPFADPSFAFATRSYGHTLEVSGSLMLIFGGITAAGQSDELWQVRMPTVALCPVCPAEESHTSLTSRCELCPCR